MVITLLAWLQVPQTSQSCLSQAHHAAAEDDGTSKSCRGQEAWGGCGCGAMITLVVICIKFSNNALSARKSCAAVDAAAREIQTSRMLE